MSNLYVKLIRFLDAAKSRQGFGVFAFFQKCCCIHCRRESAELHCPGPNVVSPDVARLQAWNGRMGSTLKDGIPICKHVAIRTEFSGVGTAEEALKTAVAPFNTAMDKADEINLEFQSMGDWDSASRYVAMLNSPSTCRFGDIMGLAGGKLRDKLQAPVTEEAGQVDSVLLGSIHTFILMTRNRNSMGLWFLFVSIVSGGSDKSRVASLCWQPGHTEKNPRHLS